MDDVWISPEEAWELPKEKPKEAVPLETKSMNQLVETLLEGLGLGMVKCESCRYADKAAVHYCDKLQRVVPHDFFCGYGELR